MIRTLLKVLAFIICMTLFVGILYAADIGNARLIVDGTERLTRTDYVTVFHDTDKGNTCYMLNSASISCVSD